MASLCRLEVKVQGLMTTSCCPFLSEFSQELFVQLHSESSELGTVLELQASEQHLMVDQRKAMESVALGNLEFFQQAFQR